MTIQALPWLSKTLAKKSGGLQPPNLEPQMARPCWSHIQDICLATASYSKSLKLFPTHPHLGVSHEGDGKVDLTSQRLLPLAPALLPATLLPLHELGNSPTGLAHSMRMRPYLSANLPILISLQPQGLRGHFRVGAGAVLGFGRTVCVASDSKQLGNKRPRCRVLRWLLWSSLR